MLCMACVRGNRLSENTEVLLHKLCFEAHFLLIKYFVIAVTNQNQKIVLSTKHSSYYIFWQMKAKQMLKYVGYPKNGILLGPLQTFLVSFDTTVYEVIYFSIHMCNLLLCII